MREFGGVLRTAAGLAILSFAGAVTPALACDGLAVENARVIAAPLGVTVYSAYAVFHNNSAKSLTVTGADSPDFASAQFQRITRSADRLQMTRETSLVVPPMHALTLKTGEDQIMLSGPKREFKVGDKVLVNLYCGSSQRPFNFTVQAPQVPHP